jgi:hypothetical protein
VGEVSEYVFIPEEWREERGMVWSVYWRGRINSDGGEEVEAVESGDVEGLELDKDDVSFVSLEFRAGKSESKLIGVRGGVDVVLPLAVAIVLSPAATRECNLVLLELLARVLDFNVTTYPSGYSFESITISPTTRSVLCLTSPLSVSAEEERARKRELDPEVDIVRARSRWLGDTEMEEFEKDDAVGEAGRGTLSKELGGEDDTL